MSFKFVATYHVHRAHKLVSLVISELTSGFDKESNTPLQLCRMLAFSAVTPRYIWRGTLIAPVDGVQVSDVLCNSLQDSAPLVSSKCGISFVFLYHAASGIACLSTSSIWVGSCC